MWATGLIFPPLVCVTIACFTATTLLAQSAADVGGIQLTLVDENGAVVPHAKVAALNNRTGVQVTGETSGMGTCLIAPLPFGEYMVDVDAKGFEKLQKGVLVNQALTTAVHLKALAGNENATLTTMDDLPSTALMNALIRDNLEKNQDFILGASFGVHLPRAAQQQPSAAPRNMQGVTGLVVDPGRNSVPNAQVTLTDMVTGIMTTVESGSRGDFALLPLPPGRYNIEVVAKGFQRMLEENIKFDTGQTVFLDVKLTKPSLETPTAASANSIPKP